jgi:hypothetical protein
MSTAVIVVIVFVVAVVIGGIAVLLLQKRRTKNLRSQFGGAEYERAVTEVGSRRHAEAKLDQRAERVQSFHLKALSSSDRLRYVDSWAKVQAHFLDGPASAVTEADHLVGDLMATRGYPVSDFEQRAADISVDHPNVTENYRAAHAIASSQIRGEASTEDLRKAMIHYRTLFEDLAGEPKQFDLKVAS